MLVSCLDLSLRLGFVHAAYSICLRAQFASKMEVTKHTADGAAETPKPVTKEPSPEVAVYLHLLIVIHLIDKKHYPEVQHPSVSA